MLLRLGELTTARTAVILLLTFTGARCWVTSQRIDIDDKPPGPRVLLSVSSLITTTSDNIILTERFLELNWFDAPPGMNEDPTSWVGLFNHDPSIGSHDPLEVAPTRAHPDGHYITRVPFPRIEFFDSNLTDGCLGFWIGYINLNRLVTKSCIRARPHWMQNMRDVIGNQTLKDLMLPGTHNAGSYESNAEKIMFRYQMCQDENIFNQLVYGNRFLDLRVYYSAAYKTFWISHSFLKTNNTVQDVLLEVKRFLDNSNEIVIIDFHLFHSMGLTSKSVDERHKELIRLVISILGNYMMPTSFEYSVSLNDIWNSNKRLLVGYAAKQGIESTLLYPGTFHLWGNKESKAELEEFLERNVCHFRHHGLWSAMAELTPSSFSILKKILGNVGLRVMAQDVNRHVTKWFRERWWKCANIVATDFFLGNNIIEVAIEANSRKFGISNNIIR